MHFSNINLPDNCYSGYKIYNCKLDLLEIETNIGIGYLRQHIVDHGEDNQFEYRVLKFVKKKFKESEIKNIEID